ncbi:AraC family transcriptional regulator [Paenibacillus sp. GYB004]|uniref:AraC family transcriptional regulator n=1 Tax=Paenibacillus sp. GYB004 TaxID=2994393 RepID=UPI002F961486
MRKKRSSRFLVRLIAFSLLLVTVPVTVMGIFSYYKASDMLQQRVRDSNGQLLLQIESKVEQVLRMTDASAVQYTGLPLVTEALDVSLSPHDFKIVNNLLTGMNQLQAHEWGIHDIKLIDLNHNWMIDAGGLSRFDRLAAPWAEYAAAPQTSYWIDEGERIRLVKKIPVYAQSPQGLLTIAIPVYEFEKLIGQIRFGGTVLVLDKKGKVLAGGDRAAHGRPFETLPFGRLLSPLAGEQDEGHYTSGTPDGEVEVTYRTSPYNGWTYISVVPIGEMSRLSKQIGLFTVALCGSVALAAFVLAYWGLGKMYSPIRRLVQSASGPAAGGQTEGVGAEDEWELIGSRLSGLMSAQTELFQQLQGQSRQLKEFFVLKLLQNEPGPDELKEKLALFEHARTWTSYIVLVLQIDSYDRSRYGDNDRDLIMFAINNMVTDLIPAKTRLLPVVSDRSQITIVGCEAGDEGLLKRQTYELALDIQQEVKRYLRVKTSIGISRRHEQLGCARTAFKEAAEALKYRMKLGDEAVLFIEEAEPEPDRRLRFNYPAQLEQAVVDAVKMAERERIGPALAEFGRAVFANDWTHHDYSMSYVRLLTELLRVVQDGGGAEAERLPGPEGRSPFHELLGLRTAAEIEQWLLQAVIEPAVITFEQQRKTRYRSISREVIAMIENECDMELTLESCASRMNYSSSYIAKVFRRETGMSFSDYVMQVRLQTAKRWLAGTEMKVAEIADKLKYNSSANFIRYFRKAEGVTPGQYREDCRSRK